MIRVMIVEDEPASARFLTQLLETRCRGVQVAALAEDGQAAIKTLKNTMVDIVITDIQMSPMDGLRLAGWIKENMPDIDTLIVSGHNDFEYAKGAISSGVAEYLLKPIRPSEFSSVMEKLIVKVRQRKREKCEEWLIRGLNPGSNEQSPFPCQCGATLGAVRLGGVSGGTRMPARKFEYPSDCPESLAAVYAREGYEVCFALPVQDSVDIEGLVSVIARDAAYFTAFYNTIPYGGSSGCLPDMLDKALKSAVLGRNQTFAYINKFSPEIAPPEKERSLIRSLRYAISNSQLDKIKTNMTSLFALWETEGLPVWRAVSVLTGLLQLITDYAPVSGEDKPGDIPSFAFRICNQAAAPLDLLQKTWGYCEQMYRPLERSGKNGDMINRIEYYIREHLSEPLTTQQICSVFQISGSHLTQMFRHFVKMSFVEYVTQLRIDEAKRLMAETPGIPVKDVAALLGFSDQFYFSKVFKSVTGVPPSEYRIAKD